MRSGLCLGACLLVSCADVGGSGLALRDPQGVIDEVGGKLRVRIVSATNGYVCTPATGQLDRDPAAADVLFENPDVDVAASAARVSAMVPGGTYLILVEGRGRDPFTMENDVIIASGCSTETLDPGGTRPVVITLQRVQRAGTCGNSVVSADEQCDDGNTASGDGCDGRCQSEVFDAVAPATGAPPERQRPSVAWASGTRAAVPYSASSGALPDVRMMLRDDTGKVITNPTALAVDGDVAAGPRTQDFGVAGIGGGRIGVAYVDQSADFDVRVRFFDPDRAPLGTASILHVSTGGDQASPAIALASSGAACIAFVDTPSTSVRARIVAAMQTTPLGTDAFTVGAAGGSQPSVAALDRAFVVAYATSGGDVVFQRIGVDGMLTDATPRPVLDAGDLSGIQDQPVVASLGTACASGSGCFAVAWRDAGPRATGGGTDIVARLFGADGAPTSAPFLVDTTAAGDQSLPTAAAGAGRFAFAWQQPDGSIRGRVFDATGTPALSGAKDGAAGDDFAIGTGTGPRCAIGGAEGRRLFCVWEDSGIMRVPGRLFVLPTN